MQEESLELMTVSNDLAADFKVILQTDMQVVHSTLLSSDIHQEKMRMGRIREWEEYVLQVNDKK